MPDFLITGILILTALALGSFLNNLISFYLGNGFDLLHSKCLCGKRNLTVTELIPVFSRIQLKGKCRECELPISIRYPIVEILSAALMATLITAKGFQPEMIINYLIGLALLIIAVTDYYKQIIPNGMVATLLLLGTAKYLIHEPDGIFLNFAGVGILVAFLILYNIIRVRLKDSPAIGMGDIKLIAVSALFADFPLPLAAVWLASIIAIPGYFLLRKFGKCGYRLPYGMFLSIGYGIVLIL